MAHSEKLPLLVIALAVLSASAASASSGASVVNIHMEGRDGRMKVSALLSGALPDKTEEAVMSGLPVTFTWELRLVRERAVIWDDSEEVRLVHKTVKYDTLTREFNALEETAGEPVEAEEFDGTVEKIKAARGDADRNNNANPKAPPARLATFAAWRHTEEWIRTLKETDLGPNERFEAGEKYFVEIKASSRKIKLIPPFNILLFFLDLLNFDTPWERSSPFVVDRPAPAVAAPTGEGN